MKRTGISGVVLGGGAGSGAVLGAVKSAALAEGHEHLTPGRPALPFVTISRQAGAGGRTLARRLAERLHAIDPPAPGETGWAAWDEELVAKVAHEYGVDEQVIQALETTRQPWFADLLAGLTEPDPSRPDEFRIYKRTAAAIRGLAKLGRAILVGRGGVFLTSDLPGGVHVRLIAPRAYRISYLAHTQNLPEAEATRLVDETDRARETFYRRHWPSESLAPERFTVTLNTAGLRDDTLVDAVLPLVHPRHSGGQPSPASAGVEPAGV